MAAKAHVSPTAHLASGTRDRSGRLTVLGAALVLGAFVALAGVSFTPPVPAWLFVTCMACAWIGFVLTLPDKSGRCWLVLTVIVLGRLVGLAAAPIYEDDWARYLWDGFRFLSDGTPYGIPPSAFFADTELDDSWQDILDRISYPQVPTIYAPVLQGVFAISTWIAPASLFTLKSLLVATDLVVVWIMWRVGGPGAMRRYGLCPLVVFEVSFNAHADIVGVAFLLAAVLMAARGRAFAAGAALGMAIATKVFALALLPFMLIRFGWRAAFGTLAVLVAAYGPFLLQGTSEREGLQAFAAGWEFNSFAFAVVKSVAGDPLARVACVTAAAAFGAWWWWRWWRGDRPWPPDLGPFYAVALLLSPVVNSWYLLWLAPWAALHTSAWRFGAMAAVTLSYLTAGTLGIEARGPFDHPPWVRPAQLGVVVACLALPGLTSRLRRARLRFGSAQRP